MKQLILSAAILFSVVAGKSQTGLSAEHTASNSPTWTSAIYSVPTDPVISSQRTVVSAPDSITMRILRNTEGEVVKTLRYYTATDVLPLHIQGRLATRFPDYSPTAIIEDGNAGGVKYIINLSKGGQWLQVHVSSKGRISIKGRYHNSLLNAAYQGYTSTLH